MKKRKIFTILSLGALFILSGCFGSSSGDSGSSDKTADSSNASVNNSDDYFIYDGSFVKAKDTSIAGDLVIPSEFNGQSITTIPKDAFKNCSQITSIVVPDSVTTIGEGAFSGCISLNRISIPFVGLSRNETTTKSLFGRIFGTEKYSGSEAVKQFDVGNSTSYSAVTFYIPSSLRKVVVTSAVTLGDYSFQNCSMLEEIELNDGLVAIGTCTFDKCSSVRIIKLPNLVSIPSRSFRNCSSLECFNIGDDTRTIGEWAFMGCSSLVSINSDVSGEFCIPETVTEIGEGAFSGCIRVETMLLPFIGTSRDATKSSANFGKIFGDTSSTGTTKVEQRFAEKNMVGTTSNWFYIPNLLRSVTITDASKISYGAFQNCNMITELNINTSAKQFIGDCAFENCVSPYYFSTVDLEVDVSGTIKLNAFSGSGGVESETKVIEITTVEKNLFNDSNCKYIYFSIYYDNYGEKVNVFDNWGMVKFIFKDEDGDAIFTSNDVTMKHNDKYRTDEFNHKMTIADFNKLDKVELYFWYDKQDVLGASGNWSGQDYNVKNIKVVMQSI